MLRSWGTWTSLGLLLLSLLNMGAILFTWRRLKRYRSARRLCGHRKHPDQRAASAASRARRRIGEKRRKELLRAADAFARLAAEPIGPRTRPKREMHACHDSRCRRGVPHRCHNLDCPQLSHNEAFLDRIDNARARLYAQYPNLADLRSMSRDRG